MSVSISPIYNEAQYFDNDGNPLSGGKIFQYQAGSFTVQETTYSDETGNIANPNPIVLDSSGRSPTTIFLTDGIEYNLVLTMPDGTTILDYKDFVVGVEPAASFQQGISVWNTVAETPTYVNGTTFIIPGVNYTSQFFVGNRVRITYTDTTTSFGTVTSVTFSAGNTNVVLAVDSGVLLSNMEFAAWSSLIANGITVDAAGVTYKSGLGYAAGSVGNKINTMQTDYTTKNEDTNYRITRNAQWVIADYSNPYDYVATFNPGPLNLGDPQVFTVVFVQGNGGNPSALNVNGLGAYPLQTYDTNGALTNARITAYMTSQVVYSGSAYLVLDRLPDAQITPPRGESIFTSNGTFTVPANVYGIKVTCVGGGGSGLGGGNDPTSTWGIGGGGGATAVKYLSVTPGQSYAVAVGNGGNVGSAGAGGTTSFGISLVVANGGTIGTGATTGTGDVIFAGGDGFYDPLSFSQGGASQAGGQFPNGYGCGGRGDLGSIIIGALGQPGRQGICIVEW